ncbi:citrulline utilization hydrolase CtlX [Woeseia oceani]|uniref:Amidinotransferase n=1 Tax=Woeseia oceani TaxID=1548547 RepID=A0A193LD67_9GAMM|nr:arginine deiminase-related protein [Woeseia oceani]ANO50423.1 amidinotransferase [Woeseia oceani]
MTSSAESQLANAVLMIRPVRFFSNPLTAASNRFQGKTSLTADEQQSAALAEFNGLAAALERAGVDVVVVDDTAEPPTPDAVFPNNWISTHADGTVVLYPMEAENRRTERRQDIIDGLAQQHGFHVRRVIDLSPHEERGHYLEGTGSLVLDRVNRLAYACLSSRTHLDVLGDFAQQLDYDVLAFDAVDSNGAAIYHTNVLMNVGETLAVICLQAIRDAAQREAVQKSLIDSGHALVDLSYEQLESFAGNMLELRAKDGGRVLAMSAQAHQSLTDAQRAAIEAVATIVSAPIDRIEASAGGSVRCMLAELHLPRG